MHIEITSKMKKANFTITIKSQNVLPDVKLIFTLSSYYPIVHTL